MPSTRFLINKIKWDDTFSSSSLASTPLLWIGFFLVSYLLNMKIQKWFTEIASERTRRRALSESDLLKLSGGRKKDRDAQQKAICWGRFAPENLRKTKRMSKDHTWHKHKFYFPRNKDYLPFPFSSILPGLRLLLLLKPGFGLFLGSFPAHFSEDENIF